MATPSLPDLRITFANARGDATHSGPYERLIFRGAALTDGADARIATHGNHQWELPNGVRYSRLECFFPCEAWFDGPGARETRRLGPYYEFSAVDGVLYADRRTLAFCDAQLNDWYSFDFSEHYERLIVVPHAVR